MEFTDPKDAEDAERREDGKSVGGRQISVGSGQKLHACSAENADLCSARQVV